MPLQGTSAFLLFGKRNSDDVCFLGSVNDERNRLMHSMWMAGTGSETVTVGRPKAKRGAGMSFNFRQIGASDILAVADEANGLAGELLDIMISEMRS